MGTIADLILKAIEFLVGEKKKLTSTKREQRDRVADYLERIADGLGDAANKFKKGDYAWSETQEMMYQLSKLLSVTSDSLEGKQLASTLKQELAVALRSDYRLLAGSKERMALDAMTLRPREYENSWPENPVANYSQDELVQILKDETRKIEKASGLFRAVAHELRARPV